MQGPEKPFFSLFFTVVPLIIPAFRVIASLGAFTYLDTEFFTGISFKEPRWQKKVAS
jgi:hypothetical protein